LDVQLSKIFNGEASAARQDTGPAAGVSADSTESMFARLWRWLR